MGGTEVWRQLVECGSPQCVALIDMSVRSSPTRVLLSSGSCAPSNDLRTRYEAGARIPVSDWRPPTDHETRLLFSSPAAQAAPNRIAIIRIPPALIGVLRSLTSEEIDSCCGDREHGNPMQDLIVSYLQNVIKFDDRLTFHGLFSTQPNQLTTTIDQVSRDYIGLHFDSWDSQFEFERVSARNRLAINVGTMPRSLLFVNLALGHMRQLLEREGVPTLGQTGTNLGRLFLKSFSCFPVARLIIQPGEAYVASTDFILHEGCTLDATEATWHLTVRGRFSW